MLLQYRMLIAIITLIFVAGACESATTGNVSSFSTSGQDITLNLSDGSTMRITVVADDLLRFRLAPAGSAISENISHAVVDSTWPTAIYTVSNTDPIVITTAKLKVEISRNPTVVTIKDPAGNTILADDPTNRTQYDSTYTRTYKTTQGGEVYLGLGWRHRTTGLRCNGTKFTMKNVPTYDSARTDVFYGGVPFWYGVRTINGASYAYGLFFDDTSWGEINMVNSSYMSFSNLGGQVDYYFFGGPMISDILDRYTQLTGRPFMPPKWACGYQQARWSYTPQSQVLSMANQFRTRNIPCDVMYLDIDYMDRGYQLTFNPSTFYDPASMCSALHNTGFKTIANISPFLPETGALYNEARNLGHLLKKAGGTPVHTWHDYFYFVMLCPTGWQSWIDFTKPAAREWYEQKHAPFLSKGIDGIWNDLNEPDELASSDIANALYDLDGKNVPHNKTSTQFCLYQTEFSYNTLKNYYPNQRPFVLSRGSYAGMQRSSAVWSGDNTSEWTNHFKLNIPMGLSMSLCGQPNNGHDIGGFQGYPTFGTKPSSELFARWMQCGVFSPFCRAHHNGDGSRQSYPYVEPWQFGTTTEDICREFINLRYRLMPYLYSLFYESHTTGAPVQRPTVYDFQNDTSTTYQHYDFMFGPWMLVSPVYSAGATSRIVYLPKDNIANTGWTNWWTGARYSNDGINVTAPAPLDKLPIHVRDGAIIPMGPVMQYANQIPITELTLKLYPSHLTTSFTMFEDDGESWGYQSGHCTLTTYTMNTINGRLALDISPRTGSYVPAQRHYLAEIHNWTQSSNWVLLNQTMLPKATSLASLQSANTGFYYDSGASKLYVRFPDTGAHLELLAESPHATASSLAEVKSAADGSAVSLSSAKVVTAVFPTGDPAMKGRYVYIEEADRSTGIRVLTDNTGITPGSTVTVTGRITTATFSGKNQGERYIDATSAYGAAQVSGTASIPGAPGMSCKSVGSTNRGLLIRAWGKVTATGTCDGYPFFYITDGSNLTSHDLLSGASYNGLRVYGTLPQGSGAGSYVAVTGISGSESPVSFSELNPVVRAVSVEAKQ